MDYLIQNHSNTQTSRPRQAGAETLPISQQPNPNPNPHERPNMPEGPEPIQMEDVQTDPDDNIPSDPYSKQPDFPSDPDEESMEEGSIPSSGEEDTETSEPQTASGGSHPKELPRLAASKRRHPLSMGYYDGMVGPPPTKGGPRIRRQYAKEGLDIPDDIWDPEATSKFYKDATNVGQKANKKLCKLITPSRPGEKPQQESPNDKDK